MSLGVENENAQFFLEEARTLVDSTGHWSRMEPSTKALIVGWLENFRKSSHVKPEALISGNLWGFVIRKILLSIEENCNSNHSNEFMLQCFGEYDIGNLTSMGTKFYTDFVFTAGCHGLPILLVELQASTRLFHAKKPLNHKDLKKLALQMSAVLLEIIGMIRKRSGDNTDLSILRVFGMLIFDTYVEYYVSKPVVQENGKFLIAFEQVLKENDDHDLYVNLNDIEPEPLENENLDTMPGAVNLETLIALTNFLDKVHDYYSALDESIIELYCNPHDHEKDPQLIYPFSKFYHGIYYMDRIMSEDDPEYALLNSMESIVFEQLKKFKKEATPTTDLDFLNLFKKAGKKYEEILDERNQFYHHDATWFLLQSFIESLQSLQAQTRETSADLSFSASRLKDYGSLASSGSSSIETMPIVEREQNIPFQKLNEISTIEEEEIRDTELVNFSISHKNIK